jgi:hypothetical protein
VIHLAVPPCVYPGHVEPVHWPTHQDDQRRAVPLCGQDYNPNAEGASEQHIEIKSTRAGIKSLEYS